MQLATSGPCRSRCELGVVRRVEGDNRLENVSARGHLHL